jgi:hypothetical protein
MGMKQRDLDIDLLKALSKIEGAIEGSDNTEIKQVAFDELDWIIDFLSARIKDNKYEEES